MAHPRGPSQGSLSSASHPGPCVHFSLKSDTVVNKLFIILSPLQSFSSGGKEIGREQEERRVLFGRVTEVIESLSFPLSLSGICPGSVLLNTQWPKVYLEVRQIEHVEG